MINGSRFAETLAHPPENIEIRERRFHENDVRAFGNVERGVVETDSAPELDTPLSLAATNGNAEQLTQVLMALMLNAVDAMDDRRGKLTVRTGRNPNLTDEVFVEIEDNGVGISPVQLAERRSLGLLAPRVSPTH
jgi:signal transduction histidine kinase